MRQTLGKFISIFVITLFVALSNIAHAGSNQSFTYSVISEDEFRDYKHNIVVRLNRKVSKKDLRSIAKKLKKLERKNYERTFIAYYLPDMKIGSGAWATTHFNPNLEIKILGLTMKEEKKISQKAKKKAPNVVGIWIDDRPFMGATITIRRKSGKLFLETKYKDGSSSNEEMTERKSSLGIKLIEKGGNPHGEYYVLDKKMGLHAGGNNGLFLKYKKLK